MSAIEISHNLEVVNKIIETDDACTFELAVPDNKKDLFHYKPGQFLTIFMKINDEPVARSYSFSSSPILDKHLKVTIKRVANGKASNYLIDHIDVGQTLSVSPPAGHFFDMKKTIKDNLHYYMFAAGSGITPMYSIINWTLPNIATHKINLYYSNKSPEATLFMQPLKDLQTKYPQLNVDFLFSQVDEPKQRLSPDKVLTIGKDFKNSDTPKVFYLCGPNEYMNMIEACLLACGAKKEDIHKESFNISTSPIKQLHQSDGHKGLYIEELPKDVTEESCEVIEAEIDGEWITSKGHSDESVLEALLTEGHAPPFSCMSGSCMACLCRLEEGSVYMQDPGILTEEQAARNEFLSCQAKAISKKIKIAYDCE